MRIAEPITSGVVAVIGTGLLAAFLVGCAGTEKEIVVSEPTVASKYVNEYCPIMGGPIDPETVTPELSRQYDGKLIAFCCPGCPEQWDKLTDAEKKVKLPNPPINEEHAKHIHHWRWRGTGSFHQKVHY